MPLYPSLSLEVSLLLALRFEFLLKLACHPLFVPGRLLGWMASSTYYSVMRAKQCTILRRSGEEEGHL